MRISRTTLSAALLVSAVGCGGATTTGGTTSTTAGPRTLDVRIEELDAETLEALERDEARLVAEDVAARRAARHEELPTVERTAGTEADAWPLVTVRNNTPNGLVIWFAGPCARAIALAAQGTQSVELCEGRYDIAAQLASPDFLPFVGNGDEVENGSRYSLTFYVLVQPQTLRRVRRR